MEGELSSEWSIQGKHWLGNEIYVCLHWAEKKGRGGAVTEERSRINKASRQEKVQ